MSEPVPEHVLKNTKDSNNKNIRKTLAELVSLITIVLFMRFNHNDMYLNSPKRLTPFHNFQKFTSLVNYHLP